MDIFSADYRLRVNSFLKRWSLDYFLLGALDFMAIAFAFQCSYYINNFMEGGFFFTEKYLLYLLFGTLPFWILILNLIKFAQIPTRRYKVLFFIYLHSAIVILFILILIYFFFDLYTVSRLFLVEISFFGFFLLFLVRILEYKVFKNFGAKRHIHLNLIIIADNSSLPFIENLLSEKELGFKIFVIFTESALIKEKYEKTIIILSEEYLGILKDLIEVELIDEVLYLKEKLDPAEVRGVITSCEELGVTLRLRYNNPIISLSSAVKTKLANEKFLSFKNMRNNTYAHAIKRSMDINISLLMIVVLSPVFIILSVLIKLTSRGPLISKQALVGVKGRQINLYKFRTNIVNSVVESKNAEINKEINSSVPDINEDPRVTKTGKFLLRSGLDQLPQLFNVLNGDIKIFGFHPSLRRENQ